MSWTRRRLLQGGAAALAATSLPAFAASRDRFDQRQKPPRLREGDVVGLFNPAGATFHPDDVQIAREALEALGLRARLGEHLLDRHGYLAGRDEARAADVNSLFADPEVKALLAVRGGWGCARILPLLDYELIARHPKIVLGFSDVTALLLALHARTGLVTFHGPVGTSTWNDFTTRHFKSLLFAGEAPLLSNPDDPGESLVQLENRVLTLTPGRARGRLLGGNLAVLSAMLGSDYLPDFEGAVLFLEEVREDIYRVDRMLTQLALAGVLEKISGCVFGRCTDCGPGRGYGSLTLQEVLMDHLAPLAIPAWYGSMIGHLKDKFTVPLGVEAEIDADRGLIQLLEPAVS